MKTMEQRRTEDDRRSLLLQVTDLAKGDRQAKVRRYVELLSDPEPSAAKAAELKALMDAMGKTPEQVREDLTALQRAASAMERIGAGRQLGDRVELAEKAVMENAAAMTKEIERLRAHHNSLVMAAGEVGGIARNAREGAIDLQRVKREFPELLSHVPECDCNTFEPTGRVTLDGPIPHHPGPPAPPFKR